MPLTGSTNALQNTKTSCPSGLSGCTDSAHSGRPYIMYTRFPKATMTLLVSKKKYCQPHCCATKQINFGCRGVLHQCDWKTHCDPRWQSASMGHTQYVMTHQSPLFFVRANREERKATTVERQAGKVGMRRMTRQSRWNTKRAIKCGWDSPALRNHNVSCWSLHACSPSPPRQSCKTKMHGQERDLSVINHTTSLDKTVTQLVQKGQLQHLRCFGQLKKKNTYSTIVFIHVHMFTLSFCLPFPVSFIPLVWSLVTVVGLQLAWWLVRSSGQPTSDWDNGPDWIKARMIDGDWLRSQMMVKHSNAHMEYIKCYYTETQKCGKDGQEAITYLLSKTYRYIQHTYTYLQLYNHVHIGQNLQTLVQAKFGILQEKKFLLNKYDLFF